MQESSSVPVVVLQLMFKVNSRDVAPSSARIKTLTRVGA